MERSIKCQKKDGTAKTEFCVQERAREKTGDMLTNIQIPLENRFLTRSGTPQACINYDAMFRRLVEKYNKSHEESLPAITTPHTLRHTFCTNMANAGMNPKALQYLMGHANITMTLNYYAHATFDSAQAEFFRLAA